ncbi:MAG: exodeoxyribonuclease III [Burkholderiales bacterium]|jgi:exodeoxyribonuclease-3|nr:exodeoxyribonuclease III [Burkholderiales bacterium]
MKIATWNVNSLKVRLPHLLDWFAAARPDVVCLQEIKMEDDKFPRAEIEAAGYQAVWSGQKTYNGVAIVSKVPLADVQAGIPGYADEQRRVITATADGVRIVCAYVPNGQTVGSDKYEYKLGWLSAFTAWLRDELARTPNLVVLGDYNIAPDERDVYDPKVWEGQVLFSEPEREAFRKLVGLGLVDSFRLFDQPERSFTWWDYRMNMFKRKLGLRIDHILLSQPLAARCESVAIDVGPRALERPSDHAPVIAALRPETRAPENESAVDSRA